jgi:translation initiation factor 1 (eIF-1/SUI1)
LKILDLYDDANANDDSTILDSISKEDIIKKTNQYIEIWYESRGRKSDSYISGLPYDDGQLKIYLKDIRKKKGCNGSIKMLEIDDLNEIKVLHLQGNHKTYLLEYFTNLGLKNIKLKG